MRLFVAVDLDEGVRVDVRSLIVRMRSEIRDDRSSRITWAAPERLHLTLHFIGNVDGEMAERLAKTVASPIDLPAFRVVFGGVGAFSSRGRPNVIWLGVTEGRESLSELHSIVGHRLKAAGCELDRRPFSPHLTLARLRQALGTGTRPHGKGGLSPVLVRVLGTGPDRGGRRGLSPTVIDRVRLYESRLGRGGATHIPIATGLLRPQRTLS
jgi:RNA 2',3'-cyclic 3'-phosphodiesterase